MGVSFNMEKMQVFEFTRELRIFNYIDNIKYDLFYVERESCEQLRAFFRDADHNHGVTYLPQIVKGWNYEGLIRYFIPDITDEELAEMRMDSHYPLRYLANPANAMKINHGLMLFLSGRKDNHVLGFYFPLIAGDNAFISEQVGMIKAAVIKIRTEINPYEVNHCLVDVRDMRAPDRPKSPDDTADTYFERVTGDNRIAIIADEIRQRIEMLRKEGVTDSFIKNLMEEKPKLSRLVVKSDFRILLPDYDNMEIKMEPLNKAVYILFLRHPEGIVFKHLPDYRKELMFFYQKIRQCEGRKAEWSTIENVTDPCQNLINEKCARIRGAFISQFSENIARNYFITGNRGEAKKIILPRDLVKIEWFE